MLFSRARSFFSTLSSHTADTYARWVFKTQHDTIRGTLFTPCQHGQPMVSEGNLITTYTCIQQNFQSIVSTFRSKTVFCAQTIMSYTKTFSRILSYTVLKDVYYTTWYTEAQWAEPIMASALRSTHPKVKWGNMAAVSSTGLVITALGCKWARISSRLDRTARRHRRGGV